MKFIDSLFYCLCMCMIVPGLEWIISSVFDVVSGLSWPRLLCLFLSLRYMCGVILDIAAFLRHFAAPETKSHCRITSAKKYYFGRFHTYLRVLNCSLCGDWRQFGGIPWDKKSLYSYFRIEYTLMNQAEELASQSVELRVPRRLQVCKVDTSISPPSYEIYILAKNQFITTERNRPDATKASR